MKKQIAGLLPVIQILSLLSILVTLFNSLISKIYHLPHFYHLGWVPVGLVVIISILVRFFYKDLDYWNNIINEFNDFSHYPLNLKRFIFGLIITFFIGQIATVVINYYFLTGAVIYFVMHIALIVALSGSINLNVKLIKTQKKMLYSYLITFLLVQILICTIFFLFIWKDMSSLVYFFYTIMLGTMASVSLFTLFHRSWPVLFKFFICFGAIMFVLSDFLIGYVGPDNFSLPYYFINPTYIIAILSFSLSPLGLLGTSDK